MIKSVLCIAFLLVNYSTASKLNVPRILLPLFNNFPTNFTLEVTEGGCYTWTTLRPNTIRLECLDADIDSGCCARIVVSSGIKEPRRYMEAVLGEDVHTGLVLRCDVILDLISRLEIVTTTREIYLDDPPEAFEVKAYDDQGNAFSTLDGVEFNWNFRTVGTSNKSGESTVVRYITFAESPYEAPRSIEPIERAGLKGSIVLLEARQTGAAAVSVHLPHSEYKDVPTVGVQLLVMTNLVVNPAEATILKGDDLKYNLQRLQQGRMINIGFPSAQYHLMSEDNSVEVDGESGVARGLSLGRAKIVLVDGNVGAESDIKPPTATLVVSEPHDLSLAVLPHRKWSVVIGQKYDIIAELHDADRRLFSLGSAVSLEIQLDDKYFRVAHRSANGSYVHGTPIKAGKTKVFGELWGVYDPSRQLRRLNHLTAVAELDIFEPVVVTPAVVLVPWDPSARAKYEIPLEATGGDGSFTWSSARSAVAVVNQRGVVKTLEMGTTIVTAAVTTNPSLSGFSKVRVLPPSGLEILDTPLEANVGEPIPVHIVLYADIDNQRVPFTYCEALPFVISLSDENFIKTTGNLTKPDKSCATIYVTGRKPGTSQLTISYGDLVASVIVAAHPPLAPLNPASGETLLTVGASRLVVFTGGPRSWALKPSESFHDLHNSDTDGENIAIFEEQNPMASKYAYAYRVTCRQLSETTLTLQVVNRIVGSSSRSVTADATVKVICGKPKHVMLAALDKSRENCPLVEEVFALNYEDLDLEVTLKDAQGRRFDNFTSLELSWHVSKTILRTLYKSVKIVTVQQDGFTFPRTHTQKVTTQGRTGVAEVEVHVVGYDREILFDESITPEQPAFPEISERGRLETPDIRASLTVRVVDPIKVTPNATDIFVGGDDIRVVDISQGSGHFDVVSSSAGIVQFTKMRRTVELKAVDLGSVQMSFRDVCIETQPAHLSIQVYRVGSIALDVAEYIERGTSTWARVILYDEAGMQLATSPSASALKLRPVVGSDIVTIEKEEQGDEPGPGFTVRGSVLGTTSLFTAAGNVISPSVPIQVFSPLRLHPRNITILAGAWLQVTVLDGPPGAHIEWSLDDSDTARIGSDGVLHGLKIGTCVITARAITIRKFSGQRIVSSQDSVEVQVVPLKNVEIHAPITQLVTGGKMPLWAIRPGTTAPLRLTHLSAARFSWGLSQDSLAEIRSVFHPIGLYVPETDMASVHLFAVKPGQVTVSLTVQVPGSLAGLSHKVEYTDSITIQIVSDVGLSSPRPMSLERLLVSTQATTELRTTRDIRGYQVTILRGGPDVVKVSPDGTLTTGNKTGSAVVAFGPVDRPWRHLVVYVKSVEYVMANVVPRWRFKPHSRIAVLPNGLDLELSLSFHDNEGNQFDAVRSNVLVDSEHKGLLSMVRGSENKTINLNILDSGVTTVRVWDSRPAHQPADYLHVRSGDVLFPAHARISVGDVVCLLMPVVTSDDSAPAWTVDDPRKLRLLHNGVAVAVGEAGIATVSHRASPRLRSRIDISPLHKVELLPHNTILTTSVDAVADYPVLLSAAGESNKRTNLLAINGSCDTASKDFTLNIYPFSCKINFNSPAAALDINTLFAANPVFSVETGLYSCRIKMIGKPSPVTATLAESVILTAASSDGSIQSRSTLLSFSPSLYLHQTELKVTRNKPTAMFVVSGIREVLNQIKVVTDKHLVTITLSGSSDTSSTFSVTVDSSWWTLDDPPPLSVVVWSPVTQQKLQLRLKCTGLRMELDDAGSWIPWITASAAVLIVVVVLASRKSNPRKEVPTTESPFLQTPQPPNLTLTSHLHSPYNTSRSSPEFSPTASRYRAFDDDHVYGSPWRKRLN